MRQEEPGYLHWKFNEEEELDPTVGYGERHVGWFEANILPDLIKTKERLNLGPYLLDIGCAHGYFTARYAKIFDWVYGIDFAESRLEAAEKYNHFDNGKYVQIDLTKDDIKERLGSFDSAISSAVFQHINPLNGDRVRAFQNVRNALKDGGYLVLYDEDFNKRQDRWGPTGGVYEPLSPEWIREFLPCFELTNYEFICMGGHGEYIFRFELKAI